MGGIVPVYMGAPNVPNITTVPSFINVMDFRTPKELAKYLLYLEKHPDEYNKYNAWRTNPNLFDRNYLRIVQRQMPGQEEMQPYKESKVDHFPRRAACCRLCDEAFVLASKAARTEKDLVHAKWTADKINHHLFGGAMHSRPGSKAKLAP